MTPRAKNIIIAVCLVLIGLLIAQMCRSPKITQKDDHRITIDSLKAENAAVNARYVVMSDSIRRVVAHKDTVIRSMDKSLRAITQKYNLFRSSGPSHDTIVQNVEVYDGAECIEKLPIIQAQLDLCMGQVDDLNHMVALKDNHINAIQSQFDKSIQLNEKQKVEQDKLKRRIKWQKVAMIGEAVAGLGLVIFAATR